MSYYEFMDTWDIVDSSLTYYVDWNWAQWASGTRFLAAIAVQGGALLALNWWGWSTIVSETIATIRMIITIIYLFIIDGS